MAVTFEIPPIVHNSPQFSRLSRSPSPHPRLIPAAPKSNLKKTIEAVKNRFKIPRGAIKHWLLYGPRHSDIFPRRYPIDRRTALRTSGLEDGEGYYYQIGLRPERDGNDILKASSPKDENADEGCDSGVDMSEEEIMAMLQDKLWVVSGVVKDGGACVWWKI
jgi:hypothetical protein